ncbi:MAG: hypothetical protein D6732_12875 [Methanobacteriota archaeon]|nr:MAG: hypothetical protein D6732_12875 [Euryarchaeota archaeon]
MRGISLLPILSTSIWGISIVAGKILGTNGLNPLEITFFRFTVASICFVPILFHIHFVGREPFPKKDTWKSLFGLSITGVALNNVIFYLGLEQTDASVASLLVGLNPLVTMLFAVWMVGERLTIRKLISVIIGLFGVFLIVGNDLTPGRFGGNLLIILAASIWAASFSFTKIASRSGLSSISITGWSIILGTFILLPFQIAGGNFSFEYSSETIYWLGFMGVVSSVFAYIVHYKAIEIFGPSRVAPSTNIIPLSGALASFFILHEKLSPLVLIGGALIVIGVITAQLEKTGIKQEDLS